MALKKRKKASKAVQQTSLSPEGYFEPFNTEAVPWHRVRGYPAYKRLGRYGGGSQVGVGIDILRPGQYSNRFHYHLHEEEHIFILRGSATLILGSRRYIMTERHYCCFPAAQRAGHHLFNHTQENCVFMTIGDHKPEDIACFPESQTATYRASGKTVPLNSVK